MTDEQLKKLPLFAQREIVALRSQVERLNAALGTHVDKIPTRIRWGCDTFGDGFGYIQEHETIFFQMQGKRSNIRARLIQGEYALNINTDGQLIIEPRSTNDFTLRLKP